MTGRLIYLEDADIRKWKQVFADDITEWGLAREQDVPEEAEYFNHHIKERKEWIEKLQACLKGEEGLDENEIRELLDRVQYEVLHEPSYNFKINEKISEKLKGYLGE